MAFYYFGLFKVRFCSMLTISIWTYICKKKCSGIQLGQHVHCGVCLNLYICKVLLIKKSMQDGGEWKKRCLCDIATPVVDQIVGLVDGQARHTARAGSVHPMSWSVLGSGACLLCRQGVHQCLFTSGQPRSKSNVIVGWASGSPPALAIIVSVVSRQQTFAWCRNSVKPTSPTLVQRWCGIMQVSFFAYSGFAERHCSLFVLDLGVHVWLTVM